MTDPRAAFEHYIEQLYVRQDEALEAIYLSPAQHNMPQISILPYEGYLLQWLMRLIGARKVIEIGALAGYSGTWLARALPEGGKLYSIEKSSKHAAVARANFQMAGVADSVELMEGNAIDMLLKLEEQAPFDMVFIDANKGAYRDYLDWSMKHLRVGGIFAAHNAYRHGRILQPEDDDDFAMDAFNRLMAQHPQLNSIILPLGDAMAVGIKVS